MFSLALCTYNRSNLLAQALESLCACQGPRGDWELLVIDNNSTDGTSAVAGSFAPRLPLRYVFEPVQGLSAARNRALRECKGEVLLFTDDDVRFDADWLRTYEQAFAGQPEAGWFGGRVRPLWPEGKPKWLHDENLALISGLLVHYDLGALNRPYATQDPAPFGASFALRRAAIATGGEFRADLGVRAGTPGRGEEVEYVERLRRGGVGGFYVGASSAWHWQDAARFRWPYLYRYGVQKGIAEARTQGAAVQSPAPYPEQAAFALKALLQLLKGRGDRARQCVINMGIARGVHRR